LKGNPTGIEGDCVSADGSRQKRLHGQAEISGLLRLPVIPWHIQGETDVMKDELWEERGIAYRTNVFDGSRKTLIFIHGLGPTCSGWEPYETALENDFNILTYDLRGHGFSKKYKNYADYDLKNLADDLRALLDYLGIHSCSLVSNSLGTLVALLYVHYYPGTVRSNLLLAPIYKEHSPTGAETKSSHSSFMNLLSLMPFTPRNGKRVDYSRFEYTDDLEWRRLLPEIKNLSLRIYLFYLYQMNAFTDYAWWSQIRIPTTIVHGTKDTFAPYHLAVELSKAVPNAKLVTLEGANHIMIINNKKEIIAQIMDQ
jgi:pimeloyl-ACP methyl ester carboxylesterase